MVKWLVVGVAAVSVAAASDAQSMRPGGTVASAAAKRQVPKLPLKLGWYVAAPARCGASGDEATYVELAGDGIYFTDGGPSFGKVWQVGPTRYEIEMVYEDEAGARNIEKERIDAASETAFAWTFAAAPDGSGPTVNRYSWCPAAQVPEEIRGE